MRTTVIPAQITTVEDKIAGNLNLTQIFILMIPIFWTAIVYTLFIPTMHLSLYKIPLMIVVLFICLILSLRIRGVVVFNWLLIVFRYNLRPTYYVFNKNDQYLRTLYLQTIEKKHTNGFALKKNIHTIKQPSFSVGIGNLIQFKNVAGNPNYSIRYMSKKGGINVAFEQIKTTS